MGRRKKRKQTGCLSTLGGIFIILIVLSALFGTSEKSSKQTKGTKEPSEQSSPAAQPTAMERQQIKWDILEPERKKIFTEIYKADYTTQQWVEFRFPESRAPNSAESRSEYFEKKNRLSNALFNTKMKEIAQKYNLTRKQLDAIRGEGEKKQWASDIPDEVLEPVKVKPKKNEFQPPPNPKQGFHVLLKRIVHR